MNKNENGAKQSAGGLKEVREIIFGEALNNIQKRIDDLTTENKNLKDKLKEQESNISKAAKQIEELVSKTSNSDSEQKKTKDIIESLTKDYDKKISDLNTSKIGKNQIGQAFIEWGMKVKQDDNS